MGTLACGRVVEGDHCKTFREMIDFILVGLRAEVVIGKDE